MKRFIFVLFLALSLAACGVTAGYINVTQPSITSTRSQSLRGAFRIVLTLSNPETHKVTLKVSCYPAHIIGENSDPEVKIITMEPRSDKDVSFYTMGSSKFEIELIEPI